MSHRDAQNDGEAPPTDEEIDRFLAVLDASSLTRRQKRRLRRRANRLRGDR
jgi:hypothetical protein